MPARPDPMPEGALDQIAAFFQVLAEPTRLQLLRNLRDGERSVGELALALDTSAANASRHLALLHQQGLVERESRGSSVVCRIADPSVFELCEVVCGTLARRLDKLQTQRLALGPGAVATARGSPAGSPGRRRKA